MSMPLRDPRTGRFLPKHPKKQEPIVALAFTVVYVVCFCSIALLIALTIFFLQVNNLRDEILQNRKIVKDIQAEGAALVVVPEVDPSAPELLGEPDPVYSPEDTKKTIRIFRGSEVSEEEI
jgi:hypothetical protein